MKVVVIAHDWQREELLIRKKSGNVEYVYINSVDDVNNQPGTDALFILKEEEINESIYDKIATIPVLINSVIKTLGELKAPENFHRINGWTTFCKRDVWEVATNDGGGLKALMDKLEFQYAVVKDEPGLVAARVISMIINEAYFALEENVSSKAEINTAMKLGTNYPFGPFEWSEKIGIGNIYGLLDTLSKGDKRYEVSGALAKEVTK
jgi:3-hydroxybutyryl-CoA dehydrogenase